MIAIGLLLIRMLCGYFKPRQQLEAELIVLRHRLNILQRQAARRPHLRWVDRALFIWLHRILQPQPSSGLRPLCVGIEWALPLTGDGSPAHVGEDRGLLKKLAT